MLDALECNFKSIEADVYSIGDSLFVAHGPRQIKPGRTLRNLYLDPLNNIVRKNNGSVYGDLTEIILLVDIKDDALETYQLLHNILKGYSEIITSYQSGSIQKRAVSVIVSGNRPLKYMKNQELRYAGYDGRLSDLGSALSPSLMPLISDNWQDHFNWMGKGKMPGPEKKKLQSIVDKAHQNGYMLRFWATPASPVPERDAVWKELISSGADLVGADDLKGLQSLFLTN